MTLRARLHCRRWLLAWRLLSWGLLAVTALACPALAEPAPTTHVTQVFELRVMEPERAAALHGKLLGPYAGTRVIVPQGKRRKLVVHDTRERLAWFARLVALLDVPGADEDRIFARPVAYRTPTELADLTRDVLGTAGREVLLVPDDRSATLLVKTSRDTYAQLDQLLRKLDRPAGPERRRAIRVTPAPADGGKNLPLPGVKRSGGQR